MDNSTAPVTYQTSVNGIALPIFAALSLVINYIPLLSLLRVKNIAAITWVIINGVVNLTSFINAIIWPNDNQTTWFNGAGLCDIEVNLKAPIFNLMATSICCLMKDLARAVDSDNPRLFETRAMRRRKIIKDCLLIFGIPFIQMALHYTVQTQRYAIIAVYGCIDMVDTSWPTIAILTVWPVVFALLTCYYSVAVMYRLRKHRGHLSQTLSSTGSGLDARKFLKLFFMSCTVLVIYLPITCYFFYIDLPIPFTPYSWSRIHNHEYWDPIIYFHTADFPTIQYENWPAVSNAVLIFVWYGMNTDAIEKYRLCLVKCGFAKIWPGLREPYQPTRRTSGSRGSFSARFDVISKAAHYLDGTRKPSQGTSTGAPSSDGVQSRKGSVAQYENIALCTSRTTTSSTPTSDETNPSAFLTDLITPIPSNTYLLNAATISEDIHHPGPVRTNPHSHRNAITVFRTHMNLPFPLFSTSSKSTSGKRNEALQHQHQHQHAASPHSTDLEAQAQSPTRQNFPSNDPKTVETNIWSGGTHDHNDDEHIDPLSPKMGTRAYRERERREREKMMKEKQESKDKMTRVIADNVQVELGLPIHGRGGVEVTKELVRSEEEAGASSSRR